MATEVVAGGKGEFEHPIQQPALSKFDRQSPTSCRNYLRNKFSVIPEPFPSPRGTW